MKGHQKLGRHSNQCLKCITTLIKTLWSRYNYYSHFTDEDLRQREDLATKVIQLRGGRAVFQAFVIWLQSPWAIVDFHHYNRLYKILLIHIKQILSILRKYYLNFGEISLGFLTNKIFKSVSEWRNGLYFSICRLEEFYHILIEEKICLQELSLVTVCYILLLQYSH